MGRPLALISTLYATPGLGSALSTLTIIYKPNDERDPRDFQNLIWKKLEKIAYYRTAAFVTYALISYVTNNPTLFIIDIAGYVSPLAIWGINKMRDNLRYRKL